MLVIVFLETAVTIPCLEYPAAFLGFPGIDYSGDPAMELSKPADHKGLFVTHVFQAIVLKVSGAFTQVNVPYRCFTLLYQYLQVTVLVVPVYEPFYLCKIVRLGVVVENSLCTVSVFYKDRTGFFLMSGFVNNPFHPSVGLREMVIVKNIQVFLEKRVPQHLVDILKRSYGPFHELPLLVSVCPFVQRRIDLVHEGVYRHPVLLTFVADGLY